MKVYEKILGLEKRESFWKLSLCLFEIIILVSESSSL
jgi:hypothetical protein